MKLKILILTFFCLYNCHPNFEKPYEFESLEYYHLINDEKIFDESSDSILQKIFFDDDFPSNTESKAFINALKKPVFSKTQLSEKEISKIRPFFIGLNQEEYEKNSNIKEATLSSWCGNTYRDIFLFRKKDKISGILKICFECEAYHYVGKSKDIFILTDFSSLEKKLID